MGTIISADRRCSVTFCFNNTIHHFGNIRLGAAPSRFLSNIEITYISNTRKHDLTCCSYCSQSKLFRCINYLSYTCVRGDHWRCIQSAEINVIYINYSITDCTRSGEFYNRIHNHLRDHRSRCKIECIVDRFCKNVQIANGRAFSQLNVDLSGMYSYGIE
ncbi:hypothetical protein D3C78_1101570 [compost metagenome]